MITRGKVTFAAVALVLATWGALPFLVVDGPYGEVPVPGSASVHLPAGELDVTLRTAGPAGDKSVTPLSIRMFGPDGTTQPEVIESPRWKPADSQGNMLVRVWVVRIVQDADYHVEVDGEVYLPYQSSLTFGRNVWNEPLETLAILGALLWVLPVVLVVVMFAVIGPLVLFSKISRGTRSD